MTSLGNTAKKKTKKRGSRTSGNEINKNPSSVAGRPPTEADAQGVPGRPEIEKHQVSKIP